jgi:mono/diheme cytochrome c family protein
MSVSCRNWFVALAITTGIAFSMPTRSSAAEGGDSQLSSDQRIGKRLFNQNCALCHGAVKKNNKNPSDEGTTIGPRLDGKFSGPKALTDAVAKTFILKGVAKKMPSFQYSLEPKEIDAIVNYLKTL